MRNILLITIAVATSAANSTLGTWKMIPARSTFTGRSRPKSLSVRFEPHARGQVITLDLVESDGRTTSSSSILYFDGAPREIEDLDCSGAQSSSRFNSGTVRIQRTCTGGNGTWLVRQSLEQPKELLIDVTEKRQGGQSLEWRVVLEKQ